MSRISWKCKFGKCCWSLIVKTYLQTMPGLPTLRQNAVFVLITMDCKNVRHFCELCDFNLGSKFSLFFFFSSHTASSENFSSRSQELIILRLALFRHILCLRLLLNVNFTILSWIETEKHVVKEKNQWL